MPWGQRYPQEQLAARHALLGTAHAASSSLAAFTGWLLAVSGASFAFLVAHLDVVVPHIHAGNLAWAFALFALSLLTGLLSRWLGAATLGVLAALSTIEQQAERTSPPADFSLLAFTKFFADASLPVYRCGAWRGYKNAKLGDLIYGIKPIVRRSQWQSLLALLQLAMLFLSVLVLSLGLRA
jgi:hypothetical protein